MTKTLNDALLSLAEFALPKQSGVATGGSTTTLADGTFKQDPGGYTNGVLFFKTGTYAGQYVVVTNYVGSTGTFTFAALTGAGIVAGVQYEAFEVKAGANLYDLIFAINQSLRDLGDVPKYDVTLTTVLDQEDYDLPAGVSNVVEVWIAENTTSPYGYRPHTHWDPVDNDTIRFHTGYIPDETGYKIRLKYMGAHDTLDTYADAVSGFVNWNWLKYQSIVNLYRALAHRGNLWTEIKTAYEEAQARLVNLRPTNEPMISIQAA